MNPFDPMPTIKSILGMTMAQDIEQSIMLAELDDFEAPQCEDPCHDLEPDHHSGAAGFLFVSPCGCGNWYVCVAFTKWMLSGRTAECSECGLVSEPSELTFLPIGGQK